MRHQTPIEVRKALGIRTRNNLAEIPEDMRCPIPIAEWLDNPAAFDPVQFKAETAEFLYRVYGIECGFEITLELLTHEMRIYMDATIGWDQSGRELLTSNGRGGQKTNPWLTVRDTAMKNAISIMREMGLTPSSRLPRSVELPTPSKAVANFLAFPKSKVTQQDNDN